jgi:hypothetical protein
MTESKNRRKNEETLSIEVRNIYTTDDSVCLKKNGGILKKNTPTELDITDGAD